MRQAKRITPIRMEMVRDVGQSAALNVVPLPPEPWFVRGPRGGVYLATGMRSRSWTQDHPDAWMRNELWVLDESEGARYIRPGTKLYVRATQG